MHHLLILFAALLAAGPARANDLRGHGGPVRAISVLPGEVALTASFDTTIIRWNLSTGRAEAVLRFHEGAANAVIALPDSGFASAGEDRRIALWTKDGAAPARVLEGHEAPVAALSLSPDGAMLASAGWDGTVRLWPLSGGTARVLEGHRGQVNAVLHLPDGTLVSAGYDGTIRFWRDGLEERLIELGLPVNALARANDRLIAAGADGQLRFIDPASGAVEALAIAEVPLVALAASADGQLVAAAGFRGALAIVDAPTRQIVRRMTGPAFPLWSLAFSADGRDILTGGADRLVRRWQVASGEPVNPILPEATEARVAAFADHPGAKVYAACIACHTLSEDDGNRAGPTLFRLMGRRIATAPGYHYSGALAGKEIVWNRESVARLFEIGPNAMLPGTKMPEQTIGSAADRDALVDFIEKAGK